MDSGFGQASEGRSPVAIYFQGHQPQQF